MSKRKEIPLHRICFGFASISICPLQKGEQKEVCNRFRFLVFVFKAHIFSSSVSFQETLEERREESGERLLLSAVLMAGLGFEAEHIEGHNIMRIFADEGVEFLLSCEGKVLQFLQKPLSLFCVCV